MDDVSAKEHIYNAILISNSGNVGISKIDLMKMLPKLDQSSVYRDTKKLEEEKRIRIIRKGQRTRYAINRRQCFSRHPNGCFSS